ncbi:Rv2732c family membrane protein [Corynebacterium epidermidicanis]|uniref:Uncharacterized protein n=1 Tax=Corynebacterium epidermidicanis TaxID=1050174 RepID=A0A0G3GWW4_9CORY|nr:hypothetical protein [Corynebacterium epidermidicanis]AKK03342.1 hypothetical protein CEPID_07455 [Corynebacterium epidermidicanis]
MNHTSTDKEYEDLAARERSIAARLDMSGHRVALLGGPLLIVLSWFLPYTGPITGIDLAFSTQRSIDYGIAPQERMFVWLSALGPVLLTLGAYFLRSTKLAQIGWIISGIAMFFSIFAIWMRQTRDSGLGPGPGMILGALAILVVVYGLYNVVTLRSAEQEDIAEARRRSESLDPVAKVQKELLDGNRLATASGAAENLVDERRQRAAQSRKASQTPDQPDEDA